MGNTFDPENFLRTVRNLFEKIVDHETHNSDLAIPYVYTLEDIAFSHMLRFRTEIIDWLTTPGRCPISRSNAHVSCLRPTPTQQHIYRSMSQCYSTTVNVQPSTVVHEEQPSELSYSLDNRYQREQSYVSHTLHRPIRSNITALSGFLGYFSLGMASITARSPCIGMNGWILWIFLRQVGQV